MEFRLFLKMLRILICIMKIRNIFYEDKKLNKEGFISVRPQNRGLLTFLGKIRGARIGRDS